MEQSVYHPELSAQKRKYASAPFRYLLSSGRIRGRVLDYGCGYGRDYRELIDRGFDAARYDPYFQPVSPIGKFDTVLCTYVLNCISEEERKKVIEVIDGYLKPGGVAYYTVINDFRMFGEKHSRQGGKTWRQDYVYLLYPPVVKFSQGIIYMYQKKLKDRLLCKQVITARRRSSSSKGCD